MILSKRNFGVDDPADGKTSMETAIEVRNPKSSKRVNRSGLSRKHIFDAVDASVERLGTYVDVLQIHRLARNTPEVEIMRALNDVVESGKVRYIGACSVGLVPS